MKRKGFTLIEVLIVVLIIGILAAIGMPQYADLIERSKGADAKLGLKQIYTAELEYSASRSGVYTNSIDDFTDVTLGERYWSFSIDTPTAISFTAIATRSSGSRSGQTITMDQSGIISGNWDLL